MSRQQLDGFDVDDSEALDLGEDESLVGWA
jgi:hypothetical protein